jgi:hypothetical protein
MIGGGVPGWGNRRIDGSRLAGPAGMMRLGSVARAFQAGMSVRRALSPMRTKAERLDPKGPMPPRTEIISPILNPVQ